MEDFRNWQNMTEIVEHKASGPWFTWINKQLNNPIARRLDRAFINLSWLDGMKNSVVDILDPSVSDHCPVLLNTDSQIKSLPKPFKFFKFWISHPKFYDLVKEAWETEVTGSPLSRVCKKLRVLKKLLRELNKEEYSDLRERVRIKEKELQNAQATALADPSSESFALVKEKEGDLKTIKGAEESFLRQKSREIWLKEGDSNS
ncbi:unnamed protein product [Linum trigynum]|uniref:Uncharacterized protein n=1 Tax=Linum trigynum TaxID=586398 RepID=A0AAV2CMM2_9ROSI